ncbi:hypothetical protein AB0B01_23135 [Streptomyces sp. NPDC044571]|uniref:hypothetical protein n=1 Tax=Streptomyces sp. NPDC044571 TaxID=3155371 RepID=UPI0033E33C8D
MTYWVDGATVESVAKTLQVQVPATATEAKAAHLNGLQDDSLILAFVLPTAEVDGFVAGLKPEAPLRLREQPLTFDSDATAPFTHLGLPAPDLLGHVREGQICAPCKGDLNWLKISVASVDGQNSRIYLSGVD